MRSFVGRGTKAGYGYGISMGGIGGKILLGASIVGDYLSQKAHADKMRNQQLAETEIYNAVLNNQLAQVIPDYQENCQKAYQSQRDYFVKYHERKNKIKKIVYYTIFSFISTFIITGLIINLIQN